MTDRCLHCFGELKSDSGSFPRCVSCDALAAYGFYRTDDAGITPFVSKEADELGLLSVYFPPLKDGTLPK